MIANVKFHVTRCHAVTLYKSVTLPPVDQIIIWLPNSIWSTNPYILYFPIPIMLCILGGKQKSKMAGCADN